METNKDDKWRFANTFFFQHEQFTKHRFYATVSYDRSMSNELILLTEKFSVPCLTGRQQHVCKTITTCTCIGYSVKENESRMSWIQQKLAQAAFRASIATGAIKMKAGYH